MYGRRIRARASAPGLTIQLVAGTYVVLIGMSADPDRTDRLLGFAIERTDHTEGERAFLPNNLVFERNRGRRGAGARSSERNPVQAVVWGDYTAKPDHTYTYAVTAMYGTPARLRPGTTVQARVRTEDPDDGRHGVFFNRGVAASSAYERRFGARRPDEVPNRAAYAWLSRGLEEAAVGFIGQAVDARFALHAAIYEFQFPSVLDAFRVAHEAGAEVQIVYDRVPGRRKTTGRKNVAAIGLARIEALTIPRTRTAIAHNKFVVLSRDGVPEQVWTGSTNITEGGIFGHANVGHRITDRAIAARYLAFWRELSGDPTNGRLDDFGDSDPRSMPRGRPSARRTAVFSPRSKLDALDWYVRLADSARQAVFLTAAFGLGRQIARVFDGDRDYLRYLLLDTDDGSVEVRRRDPDNVVSAGAYTGRGRFRTWIAQALQHLNSVDYVHTKLMLIDPLSDDPLVISGSANWSKASSDSNDENMLVIRGDKRAADIYLTDYMRLFSHYRLRGRAGARSNQIDPGPERDGGPPLAPDDSWAKPYYVAGSPEAKERLLFSGAAA